MCLIALPAAGVAAGSMTSALMTASVAASIGSAVMGVVGAQQQGKWMQAQANYQAAVADNNRKIAEWKAADTIEAGKIAEHNKRLETAAMAGSARAIAAASGIDPNESESALDIQETIGMIGENDALTIRSNYARQAYGYQVQGMSYEAEGELALASGRAARSAANIQSINSLLSGASSLGDKWLAWRKR